MTILTLYLLAYLMGSLPTAFIVGKLVRGIDIRAYGSGNVGVTNVVHHVGRMWVVPLVLFEMVVKGSSALLIGRYLMGVDPTSVVFAGAGLMTVAGHNWSVFLKLQGGRGLAAIGGTLLVLAPFLVGAFAVVFLPGWFFTRSSGVWVLIALASLPLWAVVLDQPALISWYCVAAVALVAVKRLLSNWTRLPSDIPKRKVLFNRLFRDRDVADRIEWINRMPVGLM